MGLKIRVPTDQQEDFLTSNDEFLCFKGTFGCGKSLGMLLKAHENCQKYPSNLSILIRKEFIDLKNSTMRDWDSEFGDCFPIIGNEVNFPNKSVLLFLHGDDINSIKNINAGFVGMIQGEEMTEEDFWFLKSRLRRKEASRQLAIECNYDGHNWIYKLFNQQKIGKLVTTNTFDNEDNLPIDYIPGLMKLPDRIKRRHLYGTDDDMSGLVWDEYRPEKHRVWPVEIANNWRKGFVLDHGFRNPTAVIWWALDNDGMLNIYDEHYESEKPISYHAEQIKKRGILNGIADPSIFSKTQSTGDKVYSIADEYLNYGITLTPAKKSEEMAALNKVNEWFKADKIRIFKNCENTHTEICQWAWKEIRGTDKNKLEIPVDKANHICDDLKYLISTIFEDSKVEPEKPLPQYSVSRFIEEAKTFQRKKVFA